MPLHLVLLIVEFDACHNLILCVPNNEEWNKIQVKNLSLFINFKNKQFFKEKKHVTQFNIGLKIWIKIFQWTKIV